MSFVLRRQIIKSSALSLIIYCIKGFLNGRLFEQKVMYIAAGLHLIDTLVNRESNTGLYLSIA